MYIKTPPLPLSCLAVISLTIDLQAHEVFGSTETCGDSGDSCGNQQSGPTCCTPGNYCQPWKPDYYQCRREVAQCGTPEVGVDFYGDDLFDVAGLKLPDECCDKCAATSGCIAFTFINFGWDSQTHCYLKRGTGTRKGVPGAVSAVVTSVCHTDNGGYCGNDKGTLCCPNTTYCQPWNSQYYQCIDKPERCPTQLTDVDFYGNDMGVSFGGYPWECCDQCSSTPGCVGYTFVNTDSRGPACYLKSGLSGKRISVGALSGVVNTNTSALTGRQ